MDISNRTTEILSSKESFELGWNHITKSDPTSIPPLNKVLLLKIRDVKRDKYYVTIGYREENIIPWPDERNADKINGYKFISINRSKENGDLQGFNTERLEGDIYDSDLPWKDDPYRIVVAWAEIPDDDWFCIE